MKSIHHKDRLEIEVTRPHRILLPLSTIREAEILLPLANAIAQSRNSQLIITNIVRVSSTGRLSQEAATVSRSRQALNQYLIDHDYTVPEIQTVVRVAHKVWDGIWETVDEEKIDMLILGWISPALPHTVTGPLKDPHLYAPPCDLVIVRPSPKFINHESWKNTWRILLPVRGGPNATIALRIAENLAEIADRGQITLLHATGNAPREAEAQIYAQFGPALRGINQLTRSLTVVNDVTEAIIEESQFHQAIVMGAPTKTIHGSWINESLAKIENSVECNLIIVKERTIPTEPNPLEVTQRQIRRDRPLAFVVDKWFAENTFQSREFENLESLIQLKEQQGLSISLGLPALNEEETVGKVISTIKQALMSDFPLLDEIVLIDSGSTDYTREIAQELGIPIYIHQEILPGYLSYAGKGEALWKSLYVLQGDIIAWIDTDIKNIHPRFVYGVIGPLLMNPNIQYVKGFYRRPLKQGDRIIAGGGGRVTELTARPLINMFYPELSGIIQPLSGEYAGRRNVLEQLPFFTGYGVETGLLLDILDQCGLQAIAQSDLLERIHHNQALPSLSKMSFTIIQVFMNRLGIRHNNKLLEAANLTLNLPRYSPNRFYLDTEELIEYERPPISSLPEYRSKWGIVDTAVDASLSEKPEIQAGNGTRP
jgi:hypothetical protein